MDDDLGYGESSSAPARPPPGGKRRERKGSLAFIGDSLPSMPKMPQIPAMLMPVMPAGMNLFASAQKPPNDNDDDDDDDDDDSQGSSSKDDSDDGSNSSSGSEENESAAETSKNDADSVTTGRTGKTDRSQDKAVAPARTATADSRDSGRSVNSASDNQDDDDDSTSTEDELSAEENRKPKVAAAHTLHIGRLRKLLIIVVVAVATVVTTYTYRLSVGYESDDFEDKFTEDAAQLYDQIQTSLNFRLSMYDMMSTDISKYARITDSSWPNVTVSEYESTASDVRRSTNAHSITLLPLITRASYEGWLAYSQENFRQWIDDSLAFGGQDSLDPKKETTTLNRYVYTDSGPVNGSGTFMPVWQLSPVNRNASIYNLDMLSQRHYGSALLAVLRDERKSVLGPFIDSNDNPLVRSALQLDGLEQDDVYSAFYSPVMDGTMDEESNIAAILMTVNSWVSLLGGNTNSSTDANSTNDVPIDCVLSNSFNQTVTFQVTGSLVQYMGNGDKHDPSYDELVQVFTILPLRDVMYDQPIVMYNTYTLSVYPTQAMEDSFEYKNPTVLTSIFAVLFFLILCLFCIFNFAVEKRQRVMMKKLRRLMNVPTVGQGQSQDRKVATEERENLHGSRSLEDEAEQDNTSRHVDDMEKAPTKSKKSSTKPSSSPERDDSHFETSHNETSHHETSHHETSHNETSHHETDHHETDHHETDHETSHHETDHDTSHHETTHNETSHSESDCESNDEVTEDSRFQRANTMVKEPSKNQMKTILKNNDKEADPHALPSIVEPEGKPVADFFPHCTVLFADIVGFNAWSSERDPNQVFTLLQALYHEFDKSARAQGVFKVETIGDSYVAVTGLPEPQDSHAVIMAIFALDCRKIMKDVTRELERDLGPDIADNLSLRIGLHSGPVTAGVLRGEKSRFQLFGDTVNIASRMESTGEENLVQLSSSTAKLLKDAGKGSWLLKRQGALMGASQAETDTYWLERKENGRRLSVHSAYYAFAGINGSSPLKKSTVLWSPSANVGKLDSTTPQNSKSAATDSSARLVDWNYEILLKLLRQVVANRISHKKLASRRASMERAVQESSDNVYLSANSAKGISVTDIITEMIRLPGFDSEVVLEAVDPENVVIDGKVKNQLRLFVQVIAGTYLPNPFHNYEHAVHVQMSMMKLLSRVVSPEHIDFNGDSMTVASDAHDYTYGITSDPLTQFSVVFAGLCHDCAHTGVPNSQLVKERANVAKIYGNKCVAEQNSVDLAWSLLMNPDYNELRECIYSNESEFRRFRQLFVNLVLATDLFDRQLSELREKRWVTAFDTKRHNEPSEESNRKATVIVEYLIQASDIAHTMQHWQIYQKWNARLFHEMWIAYESGRTDTNPAFGWYKGELWFFDNFVIPLAKKMKECRIFGVSSEECLNYASENKAMWAAEGEKIVEEWRLEHSA